MPNWCDNKVTLRHANLEMITRAADAFENGTFLDEFIPAPKELKDFTVKTVQQGTPEYADYELQQKSNIEKYGYADWYAFRVNEWGVKWDISSDDVDCELNKEDNSLTAWFQSAWSPPIEAYHNLIELGFDITAYYYEPGVGFCGSFEDEYNTEYDVEDAPSDIDDIFGISESLVDDD